ncbi:hypothetical protein BJV82DRAFT_690269 [Fennellomyces sp. T-0311]|nr:hypothetical protein BJV82DRAFT_690269 [Fennellomyces sp. T-0311]
MSLWKVISERANLGKPKRRGKYKTYRDMVMISSKRICERCFQRCRRPMVYDLPLPVFVNPEKCTIRLCLTCRRQYFKENPEPVGPNVDVLARMRYGGQIGVESYLRRLYKLRERREERLRPERDARRSALRAALASADIMEVDETDPQAAEFIRNGTSSANQEATLRQIIHSIRNRQEMQSRHRELAQRLSAHGLQVWNNVQLCKAYVERNEGNMDDIVTFMAETDWFLQHTDYKNLRHVTTYECIKLKLRLSSICGVDNEQGKVRALRKYVEKRIDNGQWNDVSLDQNVPSRPPKSLWDNIRKLTASILIEKAKDKFLVSGIRECQEQLFNLDPIDSSSLSNELFTYILDRGAMESIITGNKGKAPSIHCSVALRNTIGKEAFDAFIETNRRFVLDTAQKIYVDQVWDDIPSGISDFAASCKSDPNITTETYLEREDDFIKTKIVEIADFENVHPQYLITLVRKLRSRGCMGIHLLLPCHFSFY